MYVGKTNDFCFTVKVGFDVGVVWYNEILSTKMKSNPKIILLHGIGWYGLPYKHETMVIYTTLQSQNQLW